MFRGTVSFYASDVCMQLSVFVVLTGMPKEKYDPPDPRRMYTIMSSEEAANGKKSYWAELEISGKEGPFYLFIFDVAGHGFTVASGCSDLVPLTLFLVLSLEHIEQKFLNRAHFQSFCVRSGSCFTWMACARRSYLKRPKSRMFHVFSFSQCIFRFR